MKFSDLKVEFQNCRKFQSSTCDFDMIHYSAVGEPPLNTSNPTILMLVLVDFECTKAGNIPPRVSEMCTQGEDTALTTYSCFQSTAHSCSVAVTSVTTESSRGTTVSYCLEKNRGEIRKCTLEKVEKET